MRLVLTTRKNARKPCTCVQIVSMISTLPSPEGAVREALAHGLDYPLETRLWGWNLIGTDEHQGNERSLADTECRKRTRLGKSESCRCSNQTFS
jgi:hypothetical protein